MGVRPATAETPAIAGTPATERPRKTEKTIVQHQQRRSPATRKATKLT
jgi:hypothetical protein